MTRLSRRLLVSATLTALAGATIAALFWLVATTQGARWLLASAVPLSGISISVEKIEGTISDHLHLTGLRLGFGQQKVELDSLELRWKPLLLLTGTVGVRELAIKGVRIQDSTPQDNKPLDLSWPRVSGQARMFDGQISRLQVTGISYRRLQEQPLLLTSLDGSVTWQDDHLSISSLTAVSPSGRVTGSLSAGFGQPSLTSDLAVTLTQPLAGMDHFSLRVQRSGGKGPEPLTGTATLSGSAGARKLLELSGDLGLTQHAVNLRRISVNRAGLKGTVTADGSISFTVSEPVISLKVTAAALDLAPELNVPTKLSGTLTLEGTLNSYRGVIAMTNQAKGWQAATVTADYRGGPEGLKLAPLTATVMDGTLAGNLDLDWRNGFAVQGAISGRNINPARLDPTWKGNANFRADGKLVWSGNAPLTGSVSGTLLESTLHGQALTGELKADISGSNLSLARLVVHGKGFDLHASGELNQKLLLSARISDFSRLVPGSSGTLQSEGWLRWRDGQLSGVAAGTGNRLAYAGMQVAAARWSVTLDQGAGYPVHVTAALRDVLYDGYRLKDVTLAGDGTVTRHTLNATLSLAGAEARLNLTAGYTGGVWQGQLARLSGRDDTNGPWNMTSPTAFAVSAAKLSLSPLALTAGAGERLEVAANLTLKPLAGRFRAQWNGLNLARAKPWLPADTTLEGRISGQVSGSVLAGNNFELTGTAAVTPGSVRRKGTDGELTLAFSAAKASWNWRGDTLAGNLDLTAAEYGRVQADFRLPLAARFPVAVNPKGALRASLTARLQEKGLITAMFPGLVQESSGELDADLAASGTWETPQIGGTLRLSRAGAYLPTAGIHLKDVQLAAHLEKNLIRIDSFKALSGTGHLDGTALINLSGWKVISYQGAINGDNFQTVNFPELRMLTSPKLTFEGTPLKLSLRGDLRLPELNIVGSQTRAVVAPSGDVVREGKTAPPVQDPALALDVQVRVLLGDKVFVKISGIDARLGGALDLSFSSLDRITSKGEIKVVNGRYRTYGVNLEIVRGRLFFAGGPVDRPSLDFLALRTIGDVRAGVTVAGTLQKPVTKLYSEPAMPDVDVLAYIVLGHPLSSSGEQANLVVQAAGALLSSSQAGVLQDKIKNRLGLSTLEIRGGVGGTTGAMGYRPLQVTAPGEIPATQQPGITETVLTVGKYLTPKLYVSYGKSLFTGSNLFRLRYDLFKHWQIETQTGSGESGADIYYKLEFGGGK